MANAFVSLLQRIGHPELTSFGDSDGVFSLDAPDEAGSGGRVSA